MKPSVAGHGDCQREVIVYQPGVPVTVPTLTDVVVAPSAPPQPQQARVPHQGVVRTPPAPRPRARARQGSVPALAISVLALGAVAWGALTIARLAIGPWVVRRAHMERLHADDFHIGNLHIDEPHARPRR